MKNFFSRFILEYLRFFATLQLKKLNPTIIGITGSNGKTSTMTSTEAVLKTHRRVKVSYKANSEIGLPLDILNLKIKKNSIFEWLGFIVKAPFNVLTSKKDYDIYIAEMGIDSPYPPQNMSYLLTFLQPHIGIFLNARPVHSEPFDHLAKSTNPESRRLEVTQLIAKEKGKLIESLPSRGTAILNADDENVMATGNRSQASVVFFGSTDQSTLQIKKSIQTLQGTTFIFIYENESITVELSRLLLPHHFAYSIAPALLAGVACGLTIQQAAISFEKNFTLPPARSSLIDGVNGSLILDSSYNASTQSTLDSLELLKLSTGRRLALLGDIRELGDVTQTEHELVAKQAAKICSEVFLVGPQMKTYALPLLEASGIPVHWFEKTGAAGKYIKNILQKNDMILMKASQNTLLFEIAVEMCMANPEQADRLLCRREPFWDKKRAELM